MERCRTLALPCAGLWNLTRPAAMQKSSRYFADTKKPVRSRVHRRSVDCRVRNIGRVALVVSVAFSPNGRHVLTGTDAGTALLWDVASGKEVRRFQVHAYKITSVTFSPDGRQILTVSDDATARLWDAVTAKEIGTLETAARQARFPAGRFRRMGGRS